MNYLLLLSTISQKDEKLHTKGMMPQYHTENLKLPKYHLKKSSIPQYHKPQCPPRESPFRQAEVTLPFSLSCSVDFFSPHIWDTSPALIRPYLTPLITLRNFSENSWFNFDASNYTECSHAKQTQEIFCLDKRVRQKFHKEMRRITFIGIDYEINNSCQDTERS